MGIQGGILTIRTRNNREKKMIIYYTVILREPIQPPEAPFRAGLQILLAVNSRLLSSVEFSKS